MPLLLHIFIHFILAIGLGYGLGRYFKKPWLCLILALLAGWLIDLDHVLEYFLVFGPHFNLIYFLQGREFLLSDKIHILFHAWEWVLLLGSVACLIWKKKRTIAIVLITIAAGIFIHLWTDVFINQYAPQNYSIIYRATQGFSAPKLLSPVE